MISGVDQLDARIIDLFTEQPHIGVLGASRALGIARGTVQARLDRLQERGVITSMAPTVDPRALGFPVTAFCSLQIRQTSGQSTVVRHLSQIPEVIETHTITGSFDLFVKAVARSNHDLQRVIDTIVDHDDVQRASTQIALATHIGRRTLPLVHAAAGRHGSHPDLADEPVAPAGKPRTPPR
ncbi:transcriptional regulator, AsnC family [Austwickia chelonae]|uniref:Putative AsnC family transcriptional regulator n=1 Tax=Austwickia chelonae NBRC 105200 TaxID=1184607 RepID=K6W5K5_9MICO|nr:Lrp/AsnC family transcriptional regulator [Austwickia chelonae]GAB77102.1 putative AsnC family transcriptional regulator [Austwickia chelonae NBRC 105200]SEW02836.1 transcriptional regulator, AsnC family [Austwickia chelonae]